MMTKKSWCKIAVWFSYVSIFSSDIPLDFFKSVRVVPLEHLMYFLAGTNTKWFWHVHKEKDFAPLRILNLLIKSFVNPIVDIALLFLIVHLIHFYLK